MTLRRLDLAVALLGPRRLFVALLGLAVAGCASANNRPISVQADQQSISQDVASASDQSAVKNSNVPLMVRVKDTVSPAEAQALFKKYNCTIIQQIPAQTGNLWVLDAPKTKTQDQWVALFQAQPSVTSAEVDLTRLLVVPLQQ